MTKNDGGPAFPIPSERDPATGCGIHEGWAGMTLRDWYIGKALAGYCANPDFSGLMYQAHQGAGGGL